MPEPSASAVARRTSSVSVDRASWAVQLLDPYPTDRVLEVGPSRTSVLGLLRLIPHGQLSVLDRSAVVVSHMQTLATSEGRENCFAVHHGVLADLAGQGPFDRILTINVNAFWTTGGQPEVLAIRRCAARGGRVVIAFAGAPMARRDGIVRSVVGLLRGAGFTRIQAHDTEQAFAVACHAPVGGATDD